MTLKIKFGDYGMILVLLVLILVFSLLTIKESSPSDQRSAQTVAERVLNEIPSDLTVVVYGKDKTEFEAFARNLAEQLEAKDRRNVALAIGGPCLLYTSPSPRDS